jgi:hypothetical protein
MDEECQLGEAGGGDTGVVQGEPLPGAKGYRNALAAGMDRRGRLKIMCGPRIIDPAGGQTIGVYGLRCGECPSMRQGRERQCGKREDNQGAVKSVLVHSRPCQIVATECAVALLTLILQIFD